MSHTMLQLEQFHEILVEQFEGADIKSVPLSVIQYASSINEDFIVQVIVDPVSPLERWLIMFEDGSCFEGHSLEFVKAAAINYLLGSLVEI